MDSLTADCIGSASLAPLSVLTQLKSLEVQPWYRAWHTPSAPAAADVGHLSALAGLTSLAVNACHADPNSNWLAPLTALQSLKVSGRTPQQVLGTAALPSLATLTLKVDGDLAAGSLAHLTSATALTIQGGEGYLNIAQLPTSLSSLDLGNTRVDPETPQKLTAFTQLATLRLPYIWHESVLLWLPQLQSLTDISAYVERSDELGLALAQVFRNNPHLRCLSLKQVMLSQHLRPLAGLRHLARLCLEMTEPWDITGDLVHLSHSLPQLESFAISAH